MNIKRFIALAFLLTGCSNNINITPTNKPELEFTFDDFPCQREGNPDIQKKINENILQVLEKNKTHSIVFVNAVGMMREIDKTQDILRMWLKAGHRAGNHTFSHPALSKVSTFEYKLDIMNGEPVLKKTLAEFDQNLTLFRYPYLDYGHDSKKEDIKEFLKSKGYETVGITIDTLDWKYNSKMYQGDENAISDYLDHVKSELKNNFGKRHKDVILFHVNSINSKCLDEIVSYAKELGYRLSS